MTLSWVFAFLGLGLSGLVRDSGGASLEAYNCEAPQNIHVYSSKDVEACANYEIPIRKTTKPGQIIQKITGKPMTAVRCRVTFDITLANCGAYGHLEGIYPDFPPEIEPITPEECRSMARANIYTFRGTKITILMNSTTETSFFLHGRIEDDGDSCTSGGYFEYNGYSAYDAVVPVFVTVTLYTTPATVDISQGNLIIANTLRCAYNEGGCSDDALGTIVWEVDNAPCRSSSFISLYSGLLTWFNSSEARGVVLEDDQRVAVLRPTKPTDMCGMEMTATTVEDIFISDVQYSLSRQTSQADIFTYFETKLEYVYFKAMQKDAVNLQWIAESICRVEQQNVRLKLDMITRSPPGQLVSLGEAGIVYLAQGEAVYAMQCEKLYDVELRDTETCYQDLPVRVPAMKMKNLTSIGGTPRDLDMKPVLISHVESLMEKPPPDPEYVNLFLTPNSRILVAASPEVTCSRVMPFAFEFNKHWFVSHPQRAYISAPAPFPIEPLPSVPGSENPLLPYDSIFNAKDVQDLSHSLRLPKVREAMVTNIVRKMTGLSTTENYDIARSIGPESLGDVLTTYAEEAWNAFSVFGNAASAFIGVYLIFKLISSVLTTMFNCTAIYKTTGLSFKLLGAIFSSFTSYLLINSKKPPSEQSSEKVVVEEAIGMRLKAIEDASSQSQGNTVPGSTESGSAPKFEMDRLTSQSPTPYDHSGTPKSAATPCALSTGSACSHELYPNVNRPTEPQTPADNAHLLLRRYIP